MGLATGSGTHEACISPLWGQAMLTSSAAPGTFSETLVPGSILSFSSAVPLCAGISHHVHMLLRNTVLQLGHFMTPYGLQSSAVAG